MKSFVLGTNLIDNLLGENKESVLVHATTIIIIINV